MFHFVSGRPFSPQRLRGFDLSDIYVWIVVVGLIVSICQCIPFVKLPEEQNLMIPFFKYFFIYMYSRSVSDIVLYDCSKRNRREII